MQQNTPQKAPGTLNICSFLPDLWCSKVVDRTRSAIVIFWKISISEYVLWFCRLNANDMDRALSGYEILVHVAKHSDAIITYADTLTVRASLLTALPHLCQDSHTIRTFTVWHSCYCAPAGTDATLAVAVRCSRATLATAAFLASGWLLTAEQCCLTRHTRGMAV